MNEWWGYFNLQVSQGRQIFNKIQGGAHIVYITDSPTHVYTNIMRLVLLRERERDITIIWEIYTHKLVNIIKLEKVDGIGPSKEFPSNLLQKHLTSLSTVVL